MKPVLALDFDELFFPFVPELIQYVNPLRGWSLSLEDFHTFEFNEVWGGTPREALDLVDSFFADLSHVPDPIDGAADAIEALKAEYSLIIVTARLDALRQKTMDWIDVHFPKAFDSVHLCNLYGPHAVRKPKADVCKELGAVGLVDDSLHHTAEVARQGMRAILFGDYPWNRSDSLPDGVVRAKTWEDVVTQLDGGSR
jgi:5'(3')-deoxyribonucleotidase